MRQSGVGCRRKVGAQRAGWGGPRGPPPASHDHVPLTQTRRPRRLQHKPLTSERPLGRLAGWEWGSRGGPNLGLDVRERFWGDRHGAGGDAELFPR